MLFLSRRTYSGLDHLRLAMCPVTATGRTEFLDRVAHHVVENAAALQPALPEPGHVRPAVLLGGTGQVGAAGRGGAAGPDEHAAMLHLRAEELVFEVAVPEPRLPGERGHLLRFLDGAGEWLFAGKPQEFTAAAEHGVGDFLDVGHSRLVGPAEPDGVDGRVGHHFGNGAVGACLPHVELPGIRRGVLSVGAIGAPDAEHVGIAYSLPALHVKAGVESAADESDAEATLGHWNSGQV
jgi:hypothetical protein